MGLQPGAEMMDQLKKCRRERVERRVYAKSKETEMSVSILKV